MRDFTRNISDDDLNDARLSRSAGINRPDVDFGMEDDDNDDWESSSSSSGGWGEDFNSQNEGFGSGFGEDRFGGDSFGGSSFGGGNSFGGGMGGGFNSGFGGNSFGGMGGGFSQQYGQPNQMNQNQQMMN